MNNDLPKLELEDWMPMEPAKGPPLPRLLNILWPWEKPAEIIVPYTGTGVEGKEGEVIVVSPEEQQAQTEQEQEARAAEEAFDLPKATMDPPWGMTHEQSIAMGYTEEELRTGIMEVGHADPLTQWTAELVGPLTPEEIAFWTRSLADPGVALELYNAAALIGSVPGDWPMLHTTAPGFPAYIDEGIAVMKASIRTYARELRYEAELAEAIARGLTTAIAEEEATAKRHWIGALLHVRAVEQAASMSAEEYIALTDWPDWYTEANKLASWTNLKAESIVPDTPALLKAEQINREYLQYLAQHGRLEEIVEWRANVAAADAGTSAEIAQTASRMAEVAAEQVEEALQTAAAAVSKAEEEKAELKAIAAAKEAEAAAAEAAKAAQYAANVAARTAAIVTTYGYPGATEPAQSAATSAQASTASASYAEQIRANVAEALELYGGMYW